MSITYEIHENGETYDSRQRPEEGETWVFEKDGKWYRGETVSVRSRGWVWDQVEALDVKTDIKELHPDDYVVDEKNGKFGVITGSGQVVVPYEYDKIDQTPVEPFVKVKKQGSWGVVNCYDGKVMIPVNCVYILFLQDPFYWMVLKEDWITREDGGWELYDLDFKPATIDTRFKKVCDLEGGLCVYETDAKNSQGVVDKNLKIILPFAYQEITMFSDGLIYAYSKQDPENCKKQIEAHYIYDTKGVQLWGWDWIGYLKEGMAKVCLVFWKPKYGYINSKAELVVRPIFDKLSDFDSQGYAEGVVGHDGRFKVHRSGKMEIAPLFSIESKQYKGIDALTELDIPDPVVIESYHEDCFADCKNLKTVRISNSKNHQCIAKRMFSGCKSLEHIEIPDSVIRICDGAFVGCDSLVHIELPPHLQELESAFGGLVGGIEAITIPASVNKIVSGGGLSYCKNLKEIIVDPANEHYTSIDGALYDKAVEHLLVYPFDKETKVFSIPNTVKAINEHTFHGHNHLEKISIPASVERIGDYAFYQCMKLKEIEVSPSSNFFTSIDGVLYDKAVENMLLYPIDREAKEFVVPDTVQKLDRYAFYCCTHLERIVIPDSVIRFSEDAFYFCDKLREVVLPDDIQFFIGNIFGIHDAVRDQLTIVISRKMYHDNRMCLPKDVKIVFKD